MEKEQITSLEETPTEQATTLASNSTDEEELIVMQEADTVINMNYAQSTNKPKINNVELVGNKTLDELSIQVKGDYGSKIKMELNNKTFVLTLSLLDKLNKVLNTQTVDLPIESLVVNARYESATKELVITLQNGNEVKVPLSSLLNGLVNETTFNEKIDDLNKHTATNTYRVKNIETTLYDTESAQGEFIHLEDTALAEQKEVELGVNKAQITTKGINFFDFKEQVKDMNGIIFKVDKKGIISIRGAATEKAFIDLTKPNRKLPAGTYTIDFKEGKFDSGANLGLQIDNIYRAFRNTTSFTLEKECLLKKVYIDVDKGNSLSGTFAVMLISGTNLTNEYEPYTGGIPSPNPNYKQEINKLTGSVEYTSCGKNLWDNSLIKDDQVLENNGNGFKITLKGTQNNVSKWYKVDLKANKTYYISSKMVEYDTPNGVVYSWWKTKSGKDVFGPNFEPNKKIQFKPNENIKELKFYLKNNGVIGTFVEITDFMISEENSNYEPHQSITNTIDLKDNEVLPGDKIYLRFNPMTGKYEKILKKNMGKVVLNEKTEYFFSDENEESIKFLTKDILSDAKPNLAITRNEMISDRFNTYDCYPISATESGICHHENRFLQIRIKKSILETPNLEGFNKWLSTHNTEVVYKLADEYKTEINLGEIDIMNMTYPNVTNAFTDRDNILIKMGYYRDFKKTIVNMQSSILNLENKMKEIESHDYLVTK